MKLQITMKHPDCVQDAIDSAIQSSPELKELTDDTYDKEADRLERRLKRACERWFKYDEYLTVEIDLENNTCEVIQA